MVPGKAAKEVSVVEGLHSGLGEPDHGDGVTHRALAGQANVARRIGRPRSAMGKNG